MNNYEKFNSTLSEHTITDVKFYHFHARYPRLHGKNAIKGYHGFGGMVQVAKIFTNQGAVGWASLGHRYSPQLLERVPLIGKQLTELFDASIGIHEAKYAPFDLALHDLAGNILNMPVSRMLESDAVSSIQVYDGAIYMNDIIPEDKPWGVSKILEDCAYDYNLGHRTLKIKIGRGHMWMEKEAGLARDIEVVRKVHDAFPDCTLMVDGNDGFDVVGIIRFIEGIAGINLYWIEEPFREREADNRKLCEYLDRYMPGTYIADGESWTDIPLMFDLADKKLLNVWQPDVCGFGFTPWRKLIKQMAEKGYLGSPHAWGEVLKTHYCAHIAAAYPRYIPYIESVLGSSEGIDYSGYTLKNGIMTVPEKPGFGMDLYWAEELK